MNNSLADMYSANVGDKLVMSKSNTVFTDIYAEAIANNKWVSVLDHLINPTYVVEVLDVTCIKNKDIVDTVLFSDYSGLKDDGRLTLRIPEHISQTSLRSSMSRRCNGYTIKFFEDYLILTERINSFNKSILTEGFSTGDIKTINKTECKNVTSTISHLYKLASQMGIVVGIKNGSRLLTITHRGLVDTTVYTESFTTQVNRWLNGLPYNLTIDIPTRFTDLKSSAYINTVLNKSKFTTKVYAGKVTKLKGAIKKSNGKLQIIVNEKVIKELNRNSLTSITKNDRMVIGLILKPYKLTYEEIR